MGLQPGKRLGGYLDESGDSPNKLKRFEAEKVILAIGKTFLDRPFEDLDLHAVKGQTIRVKMPAGITYDDLPPTSGQAYIIPEKNTLAIGSSFEHTFSDENISRSVSQLLLKKASALIPQLLEMPILEEHVGIRVTVPRIRLPMVGPWKKGAPLWVFTGFGSKGLLLAPLLASRLLSYFDQPAAIPPEIQVRVKS